MSCCHKCGTSDSKVIEIIVKAPIIGVNSQHRFAGDVYNDSDFVYNFTPYDNLTYTIHAALIKQIITP